ncbi:MAG: radical SAM protein [Clostridiaceae bacterium]|nr:radical SAM protein [Clostridiaceae bacterium]
MAKKKYIIPIFIPHKGCPHDCSFCNQKKIAGETTEVSKEDVKRIIEDYLVIFSSQTEIQREVAFYGGSFTGLPLAKQKELLTPAFEAKAKGLITDIRLSTRPDYIDDEKLDLLKQYGVTAIELGVQSTDESVLYLNNRGHTKQDVIKATLAIKQWNFKLGLQMMVGLLGDNRQKLLNTAKDLIVLQPDFVRIYPTIVIKDTYLEELYHNKSYIPLKLEEAVELCKDLLLMFEKNDIPVIRLGLQATEDISAGAGVVAGPYHPAFREIVESEIYRELIETQLGEMKDFHKTSLIIFCNPKATSKVAGMKKSNKNYLKEKYNFKTISIKQCDDIDMGNVKVALE